MASQKISDFSVISSLASGDYFPVIQASDTTNKRVLTQQIFSSVPQGTASSPSLAFVGDNTGFFSPAADTIAVSNSGIQTVFINPDGNVWASGAIDTPSVVSPAYVVTNPNASGYLVLTAPSGVSSTVTYVLPGAYGTDGQSLTTDASGNFSWVSHLPLTGGALTGNVTLNAQSDLRFADSDSSNYVGFQAPATVSSDVLWTLPSVDGSTGQVLGTDGAGTLSWVTASGGGTTGGGGATGSGTNEIFYENDQIVTGSYTITSGKNAMSAGPITVASGVTVTVPSGSVWTVV